MTNPTTQESARQVLGKALRFYRDQRKMTQRDLADRVGCSIGDIDDWEKGKQVPPDHKWGRLCNMLHDDLRNMRVTWQRACAEEAREREAAKGVAKPLTARPFAGLGEILAKTPEPPKLTVVPPPEPPAPAPETLHDDGFDLRPAYRAIQKLPEGWSTGEAKLARQAYARELIVAGKLRSEEIIAEVKRRFGVGISPTTLTDLRTKIQRGQVSPKEEPAMATPTPTPAVDTTLDRLDYARMLLRKSPSIKNDGPGGLDELLRRKFGESLAMETLVSLRTELKAARTTGTQPVVRPAPPVSDNDVEGAVRLILEALPNLKSFKIDVDEAGGVSVSHTIREVRVVETSGTLNLKK